jgi:mono/diheme cytochrome c family protein
MGKKSSMKKARRHEADRHAKPADASAGRAKKWLGNVAAAGILALAVGLGVFGWSHYSVGGLVASAQPAHGKVLYAQYCASCHGAGGHGEFDWQNRARGAPALDSSGHAWHHEDAQLMSMILDKPAPDSRMPPWRGVLSRSDAADLIAYMKTLWSPYIRDNCQGARHMACMGAGS